MDDNNPYNDNEDVALVIDSGSGVCKAGFAGEDKPTVEIPTIVGYSKNASSVEKNIRDSFVGAEAQKMREMLNIKYPMHNGIITNWEEMEKIWSYAFSELKVKPENHNVLLNEPPMCPKANSEKMTQIMIEYFHTSGMHVALSGLLSMYCAGRTSGIVAECGETAAFTYPIHESHAMTHAIARTDIAGRHMSDYLAQLLRARGYALPPGAEIDIAREVKEKRAFVALDFDAEMEKHEPKESNTKNSFDTKYALPDGQVLILGKERFLCAEPVFRPSLLGLQTKPLHEIVTESIWKCNTDLRKDMYNTIVVVGGSALIPGFTERFTKEVKAQAPPNMHVRVVNSGDPRNLCTWIGGSILASLTRFQTLWISKSEYEEYGPFIVHAKCKPR